MKKKLIITLMVVTLLGALVFGTVSVNAEAGILDHVTVTPLSTTLSAGGTQQFSAQGQDAGNVAIPGLTYTWTVVAGGGTVNATGLFTAGSTAGTYSNTVQVVTTQGAVVKSAFATVTVNAAAGALDHVVITPSRVNLAAAGTQQFSAQGYDANNVAIPGLTYTWTVLGGGGTVTTTGLFTAGSVAGVQVTVTQGNITKSAFAPVTVGSGKKGNDEENENEDEDENEHDTRLPPGMSKHDNFPGFKNGHIPPGWSKGKKTGWEKHESEDNEQDDD